MVTFIVALIVAVVAYWWGFGAGKLTESMEYEDTRRIFQRGLGKIDRYENWKAQLKNITNSDDIDAVFVMAFRLIACGVDPKDLMTIDRIGMAVAEGKFEFVESTDEAVQAALDKINGTEEKK